MAESFKLTDGVYSYELVYNASTQTEYKLYYSGQVGQQLPNVLMHSPDAGPSVPIRAWDSNRIAYFTMDVLGADWNVVPNSITTLKRMVGGADSQALRYQTDGDENRVVLRVQLDGATNYTDIPVMYGMVDDSQSFYTPAASLNTRARGVVIALMLEPFGEGAAQTLQNDMASSPHMMEDSNADGLMDGWNLVGTPTTTAATVHYAVGGQAQRFTVDNSTNEGIQSDLVTCAVDDEIAAYVWVSANAGAEPDDLTIQLIDSGNTEIGGATFVAATPTGYDKTFVGTSGQAWYRYSFSDDGAPARGDVNARIKVHRLLGNATKVEFYWVDAAYIQVDTTTIPDAFCSTTSIFNRYDPTAANENRLNYLDVWGVPGDAAPRFKFLVESASMADDPQTFILNAITDGLYNAADYETWIDSDEMTDSVVVGGITWTEPGDANRSNGDYQRASSTTTNAIGRLDYGIGGDDARRFTSKVVRAFAIFRSSGADAIIEAYYQQGNDTFGSGELTLPDTGARWDVIDLGQINATGTLPTDAPDASYPASSASEFVIIISNVTNGETVDIDAAHLFFTTDDDYLLGMPTDGLAADAVWQFNSREQDFIATLSGRAQKKLGKLTMQSAGPKMTRFHWMIHGTSTNANEHVLTNSGDVVLIMIPRTRHLIGTI